MAVLLKGADVIDGTGAPREQKDVLVDNGVIEAIGDHLDAPVGAEQVDLGGLVLAPGFIDIHTHYDAQIFWDPDLTPSAWHGVTTAITGNCGFTLAPNRPEDREAIMLTLESVEAMPLESLRAGIDWSFESFPEFLSAVERTPKRVNVGSFIGHTTLRVFALGDEALERNATAEEMAKMRDLVVEAVQAGAMGFSTSKTDHHIGAYGKPVASRFSDAEEVRVISSALAQCGAGLMQIAPGSSFTADDASTLSTQLGRPVTWIALLTEPLNPGSCLEALDKLEWDKSQVIPQISCRPFVLVVALHDFLQLCAMSEPFSEAINLSDGDRRALYASPQWRARAKAAIGAFWEKPLEGVVIHETEVHQQLTTKTLAEIARSRGTSLFDTFMDLALEDDLRTTFQFVLANDDPNELGQMLAGRRGLLGLGDGGAHVRQLCDAVYPTTLLSEWVRERQSLSLEHAVWRLTGQPAAAFGIDRRGAIAVGHHADLVAFDPTTVAGEPLHKVRDLPGGADRLVADSIGIEHMWVNGTATRRDGKVIEDVTPGALVTNTR